MYLVGAEHPNRATAHALLERLITEEVRFVTDAEVLQEILHRYRALNRKEFIQPAFDALLGIVEEVYSIELTTIEEAKALLLEYEGLSARDAIHLASMKLNAMTQIVSFDSGFDIVPWVERQPK